MNLRTVGSLDIYIFFLFNQFLCEVQYARTAPPSGEKKPHKNRGTPPIFKTLAGVY